MLNKCLVILFCLLSFTAAAQQRMVELNVDDETTLEAVLLRLETSHPFLFSYKESDIQGISIRKLSVKGTINKVLDVLLKDKGLAFEVVDDKFVVLTKTEDVPDKEEASILLCGIVMDSLTQKPLAFANVYLKENQRGCATAADGSFELRVAPDVSVDSLLISYVGYETVQLPASDFTQGDCPVVQLSFLEFGDDYVVVTAYLTDGIELSEADNNIALEPGKVGALPGQAEPDVLTTIQFLPGISSCDGTLSGICVQGGTPDQNLILWEDIPVYHSAHYFGMISAFNPYIINKVKVYRGGFGADYGGRISGVIDMRSEVNDFTAGKFGAGTNLMNAYTYGQFKTADNKLSVLYSLRRSMTEIWRSPTFENITRKVQQGILVQNLDLNRLPKGIRVEDEFNFTDVNLKLAYQLSEKDKISVASFYAKNDFEDLILDNNIEQRQEDTFALQSKAININWEHQWSRRFKSSLKAHFTDYNYEYEYSLRQQGNAIPDKQGRKTSSIKEQEIHWSNQLKLPRQHRLKLGYQLTNYDVAFRVSKKNNNNNGPGNNSANEFLSNLHVLYTTFSTSKEKSIGLDAGLRYNYYERINQQYIEPRLRLWYRLPDLLNVYFNAGKYYQYLSQIIQIEGDRASIETPVWGLTGSKEIPVLNSTQLQVGMIWRQNQWLIDAQIYYKKVKGLSSLATGFDEGLSQRYHLGDANIRGLDVLLKKKWGPFKSWVSYSLSEVEHNFPTFFDEQFPGPTDQRHVLNWANQWTVGKFECSLGWRYSSGRTFTDKNNFEVKITPEGSDGPREILRPIVDEFNSRRLPAQHQLDASVLYNFYPKNNKRWKAVTGLSLFNVYHHRNIYSREIFIDKRGSGPPSLEYVDKVNMGFTPNFVFRIEW